MSQDPKAIPLLNLTETENVNPATTPGENDNSNVDLAESFLLAEDLRCFNQSQTVEDISVLLPGYWDGPSYTEIVSPISTTSPMSRDDRRQSKIDFKTYWAYLPSYFLRSLPLALSRIMPFTLNLVALHFVSYYGDARLSAGFGLGNLMYMLFFGIVLVINSEVMGILCTRKFAEEDFVGFRRLAYRGLCFKLAFAVLNSVFF
jgi:MATE family multidrug resistance protein